MSTISNLSRIRDSVQGRTLGRIEPQKSYMFEVHFLDHNSLIPSIGEMKYNVKTVAIPAISKEPIIYNFMNSKIKYAGRDSSEKQIVITFWDDEGLTVLDYIHKWSSLSGDLETGDALPKSEYVKDIRVSLKDTNDALTTGRFLLKNCFPTDVGEIQLSYEDSGIIEVPITFSYDRMIFGDGYEALMNEVDEIKAVVGL